MTTKKQWLIDSPDFEHYEIKEGNKTVCTIYRGVIDQDDEDKATANAKLIIAAPKMLEAIKNMIAELNLYNGWHPDNEIGTNELEAALKAATD